MRIVANQNNIKKIPHKGKTESFKKIFIILKNKSRNSITLAVWPW